MQLNSLLSRKRVAWITATDKRSALLGLIELLRNSPSVSDLDAFTEAVWRREEVLSTGVGLGIGVPHVRCRAVRSPVAALGVLRTPVDYGSIDNLPVSIVLMVGMPENSHTEYLEYLAAATLLFKEEAFRASLLACADEDALWNLVSQV